MSRSPLAVVVADSRAGRRLIAALEARASVVLDTKTLRRAAKIVEEVRGGGDRALLALARRLDGSAARTAEELVLSVRQPAAARRGGAAASPPVAADAAAAPGGAAGGSAAVTGGAAAADPGGAPVADVADVAATSRTAAALGSAGASIAAVAAGTAADPATVAARESAAAAATAAAAAAAAGVAAGDELPAGFREALERAIGAVERFHAPRAGCGGYRVADDDGVELEARMTPLARVGIYVPGGLASYPSTVVMTVVPARIAGVGEIVVATPAAAFAGSAVLRYTLARLGVEEVWGLGGAHAVAAMAFGTETLRRVDKVVGPGNRWVAAAKLLLAGVVGIDGLAGPSEVLIVAAAGADAALVAADLLAQAEHDPLAVAVLITPDRHLAKAVAAEVREQLPALATAATAREALDRFGGALVVQGWDEALALVERIAPEHLQLVGPVAEALAPRVRSAGAVFLGASTPEVFGDYVAGPSHVLPTCGSARFASALGVEDFLRRSHTVRFSATAAARWAEAAACLAAAEGLPAHAAAARRRLR
jgi:histidinol dehydrogenase